MRGRPAVVGCYRCHAGNVFEVGAELRVNERANPTMNKRMSSLTHTCHGSLQPHVNTCHVPAMYVAPASFVFQVETSTCSSGKS